MELVGLSIILALMELDQRYILQSAITQPLIVCSIIGIITGDFVTAAYFGTIMQLIWLGNLQVGAAKIPEGNLATAISCVIYVTFFSQFEKYGQLLLLLCFICAIIISMIGGTLNQMAGRFNIRLIDLALERTSGNTKANIGKIVFYSVSLKFFVNFILILISVSIGQILFSEIIGLVALEMNVLWQYVDMAIIGAGIGMIFGMYKSSKHRKALFLTVIIGLILFNFV